MDKTKTFLVVFHFWDDGKRENLRMRKEEEGFETCCYIGEDASGEGELIPIDTLPGYCPRGYPRTKNFLSWAPSHAEFCFLTELLTYANLLNGMKPQIKERIRPKLEGRRHANDEKETYLEIDSKLFRAMSSGGMVSLRVRRALALKCVWNMLNIFETF